MNYPNPLRVGDLVGLIAPCSPVNKNRLNSCINTITSAGMNVLLGESVTQSLHGYLAGNDLVRADDINHMFHNKKVRAILCLRGGYGSTRLMQLLDYEMIARNPKIFVGYSDVTSFHLAFHSLCNFATFHGPMVSSNLVDDFDSYSKTSFRTTLAIPERQTFFNPVGKPILPLSKGRASGRIIGGCLSLVSPCIGTFYQPDFNGKILFLEDVGESLPRCDKLMQHLINAGILDQVNGILLGNFKDCDNPSDPSYTIYDYFRELFSCYKKPVLYGLQSGHEKPMATIPFGTICCMDTANNQIQFLYA